MRTTALRPTAFRRVLPLLLCVGGAASAMADTRTSANYSILTEVADAGGGRSSGGSYSNVGSVGGIAGISSVGAPAEVAKSGYVGQLFEVVGLTLSSPSAMVNELATIQLGASQLLDDATTIALSPGGVTWSVSSGPLTSINASGLATAAAVYQDTSATAQGISGGFTATINLTVKDIFPDNYGSYAGDGIDDSWQVQYFGLNNPNAAPGVDFSGTGQTNLFKFVAGLNPLDPTSRFLVQAQPVAGQPTQRKVVFSPLVSGRTYTVQFNLNIATGGGTWATLPGATFIDAGNVRTVTDPGATDPKRFYRVQISKP